MKRKLTASLKEDPLMPKKPLSCRQRAFLAVYAETCSILRAAAASEVSRQSHYDWMRSPNPAYREAFEELKERLADFAEGEALQRGLHGVKRPVLYLGKQVMLGDGDSAQPLFETHYSDTLLIFMLKALRPEKYREHKSTKVDWDGDYTKLTEAQMAKMEEKALEQIEDERKMAELTAALPKSKADGEEEPVTIKAEPEEQNAGASTPDPRPAPPKREPPIKL
jgi:hypothetical protein